eukprot:gene30755-35792_t
MLPPRHLKVHVLSAQIPDSLLHWVAQCGAPVAIETGVQVAIEVAGLPVDDCIESSDRVKRASSVNVDVDWTFSIHYPDSCVLLVYLIDVWRGNVTSDVHGYFSLPLSNLREGSFKLHMRCKSGKPLEGAWVKALPNRKIDSVRDCVARMYDPGNYKPMAPDNANVRKRRAATKRWLEKQSAGS